MGREQAELSALASQMISGRVAQVEEATLATGEAVVLVRQATLSMGKELPLGQEGLETSMVLELVLAAAAAGAPITLMPVSGLAQTAVRSEGVVGAVRLSERRPVSQAGRVIRASRSLVGRQHRQVAMEWSCNSGGGL